MKKAISAVIAASLMLAGCSKEEVSYDPNVLNEYAISSSDYSTLISLRQTMPSLRI